MIEIVQGSASDIIKLAMVGVEVALVKIPLVGQYHNTSILLFLFPPLFSYSSCSNSFIFFPHLHTFFKNVSPHVLKSIRTLL